MTKISELTKRIRSRQLSRRLRVDEIGTAIANGTAVIVLCPSLQDELFDDAVKLTRQEKKGSTSILQRHFRIGYARAVKLIDLMERAGVVGPADGLNPRKVLRKS